MPNKNCLENKRCPKCGHEVEIIVRATMWTSLTDEGTDPFADSTDMCGGVDYDEQSDAKCPECDYEGKLREWEASSGDFCAFQGPPNQCDGCRISMPLEAGIHRHPDGSPHMFCTASIYPAKKGSSPKRAARSTHIETKKAEISEAHAWLVAHGLRNPAIGTIDKTENGGIVVDPSPVYLADLMEFWAECKLKSHKNQ